MGFRFSDDHCNYNGDPVLYVGGNYNQNQNYGLFYMNDNTVSNSNGNIGSRIQFNSIPLRNGCTCIRGMVAVHLLVKICQQGTA